ncbi:uncharacterized protein LTR77_007202 [Saxophila tyrrhenica]|uniref:Rhomboid-type serine protease n=1 Tax=Saxophila tyrrhenica TaxID=1690608 RepID=A0AAV9P4G9_9PEZI|nr:hypothetical protein LTR77_007202 [Saxophila tyrrhenica]
MAANDYYSHSQYAANPYHDHEYSNAPLPPIPQNAHSPYNSNYQSPYSHPQYASSSNGKLGGRDPSDPFDDENSIPLSGRQAKHASATTLDPILPHEQDDPFVRDADPRRKRRKAKKEGFLRDGCWVVYFLTVVQIGVFVGEIIKNAILTNTPIEIHPSFNPMIGPSPYVLINMGARYPPCMHSIPNVQNSSIPISWPCPAATSLTGADVQCTLSQLCGLGGVSLPELGSDMTSSPTPNQWYRFIIPIFLHAGLIHIGFNLLLQLTLGRDIEKLIGSVRFAIVYFASGIFGFVLGGNFAATGIASCGCSGSLFGILAITLIDLLYTWKERKGPLKDLLFIVLDVAIAFVLGLLPGLDNFSHIGGFLMGLVLGVCILRSPAAISRRTTDYSPAPPHTSPSSSAPGTDLKTFIKSPLSFFKNRRGAWWAWWLVRAAALVGVLIGFILLIENFYAWPRTTCSWCKYLSCLPVTVDGQDWCEVGNLNITTTENQTPNPSRRDVLGGMEQLGMASLGGGLGTW